MSNKGSKHELHITRVLGLRDCQCFGLRTAAVSPLGVCVPLGECGVPIFVLVAGLDCAMPATFVFGPAPITSHSVIGSMVWCCSIIALRYQKPRFHQSSHPRKSCTTVFL